MVSFLHRAIPTIGDVEDWGPDRKSGCENMRRTHSISQHCGYMWIPPKEHEILFFKAFHIHCSKHSRSIIQNIPNPSWSAYVCLRGVDDPNWLLNVSPHCSICSLFQCISTQCSFPSLVINSTYRQGETYQMYPLVNKHGYWKWPSIYSWFTHKRMVIFHSYVRLPEGKLVFNPHEFVALSHLQPRIHRVF